MKRIVLFDQDMQHYRQSIYNYFDIEFQKYGYSLVVYYDRKLNTDNSCSIFHSIKYSFKYFLNTVNKEDADIVILFVWLKYYHLLPFMAYIRIIKQNVKLITWSKGINIHRPNQTIKNQLYFLRQKLSHALLLYSKENIEHVKNEYHKKSFIAPNTLNFTAFAEIRETKQELKEYYGYKGSKVVLMIGRLDVHRRKPELFLEVCEKLQDDDYYVIIIGGGLSQNKVDRISKCPNIDYLGSIYQENIINRYYKMADVFCMPGRIGLALNHAFYYENPVVLERIPQGAEVTLFEDGKNGLYFSPGDAKDMYNKLKTILWDKNIAAKYSIEAKNSVDKHASINQMFDGFIGAIKYVS